ncbi:MAG: MGH1-like glycoside hydrolase domain-containing protein [Puniceicoccales bacterium]
MSLNNQTEKTTLTSLLQSRYRQALIEPDHFAKNRGIQPSANAYRKMVWDWDSFFFALGHLHEPDMPQYLKGVVDTFLDYQREDGFTNYMYHVDQAVDLTDDYSKNNPAKPILAQMALLVFQYDQDIGWLRRGFPKLNDFHRYWETNLQSREGLFFMRHHRGCGADNHPGLYGRPQNSVLTVELNSFAYGDYAAMATIAETLNEPTETYIAKRDTLCERINSLMWDGEDQFYYNLDRCSDLSHIYRPVRQNPQWLTFLKIKHAMSFMPLVYGIATPQMAQSVIEKHLMNEERFLSKAGIRSLSMMERLYHPRDINVYIGDAKEHGNPSNWQGPVWTVVNYLAWSALRRYGFEHSANDIVSRSAACLSQCLEQHSCLYEYYHPETNAGQGVRDFISFNALILPMLKNEAHLVRLIS